jgi:hypothetical protein
MNALSRAAGFLLSVQTHEVPNNEKNKKACIGQKEIQF